MSLTPKKPAANSTAAPTEFSWLSLLSGGTMLPTLRSTNKSPGSVEANRLGTTRLSEQAMNRQSGEWLSARCAKRSRYAGRTRSWKSRMPSSSFFTVLDYHATGEGACRPSP